MAKKPIQLRRGDKANFRTLKRAVALGDLCDQRLSRKADQADVALACAVGREKNSQTGELDYVISPLAVMVEGNPYELFEGVTEDAGDGLVEDVQGVEQPLLVSLDGGETWRPAVEVRVLYQEQPIPGEDEEGELYLNFTHEGLIRDVWVKGGENDHNIATSSQTIDDILFGMITDDA